MFLDCINPRSGKPERLWSRSVREKIQWEQDFMFSEGKTFKILKGESENLKKLFGALNAGAAKKTHRLEF